MKLHTALTLCAALTSLVVFTACEKKQPADAPTSAAPKQGDHGHEHGPGGEHKDEPAGHVVGHGGSVILLGEQVIGAFTAKATRDEGQVVPGKDAPIDVTVTPVAGSSIKATAVRFWIGTEDGKGSVRAKAEVENPAEPNRWHTHAEIPNPMPAGSSLWVEIEDDKGGTSTGSFELKA